ncbi:MAG: hypothetical protein ACOY94_17380 [Bacillota bacterium]
MATETGRRIPRVFDKYMLPKVAFVMVTGSSLAGALLTGYRHGWYDWHLLLMRWGTYYTLALLLGTEIWKLFYLRPSVALRPFPEAVRYGDAMLRLHQRWQRVLVPAALALGAAHMAAYAGRGPTANPWVLAAGLCLTLGLTAIAVGRRGAADSRGQDLASWLALAGLAGATASLAGLDVALQPAVRGDLWLLVPNRVLHVWAFAAWAGGALWNIFIAVPAGRERENMDTVILANFQLERFRVVVRLVFPTIVLTGLVQAWAIFGWQWAALLTNLWGWLILAKLGLILALVAVFITCPMWGACSPIRGVCNLDDLYAKEDEA